MVLKLNSSNRPGRPKGTVKHLHPCRIDGKVTRAYSKYQGMLRRCYSPSAINYANYGGRGITVCERWRGPQGYDNFITDMGVPPPRLTLGRVDNSKGYGPDNCAWQTWKEQAIDRRPGGHKNIKPGSLRQRAIAAGLSYSCVYQRIKLKGWTEAEALSTPNLGQGYNRRTAPLHSHD